LLRANIFISYLYLIKLIILFELINF